MWVGPLAEALLANHHHHQRRRRVSFSYRQRVCEYLLSEAMKANCKAAPQLIQALRSHHNQAQAQAQTWGGGGNGDGEGGGQGAGGDERLLWALVHVVCFARHHFASARPVNPNKA